MRSKNRARTFIFCYKKITLVASVGARTEQARSVFFFLFHLEETSEPEAL
jgi:hypothetical protein